MQRFRLLFLLLSFSIITQAQLPPNAVAPEDAAFKTVYANRSIPVVTGKLLNMPASAAKDLPIVYSVLTPFWQTQVKKMTVVQPDGSFRLQLDYPLPYQQIWLEAGNIFYAGLYADKDLYLELDFKKIKAAKEVNFNGDGVRYLGTDGPLNSYMNNYVLYRREDQLRIGDTISGLIRLAQISSKVILNEYNQLFDSLKIIEDSYIATNPSPYAWILQNERMSDYYGRICLLHWKKVMPDSLWQKVKQHKSYLISNDGTEYYNYMAIYIRFLQTNGMATNLPDKIIQLTDSLFPPAKADFVKLRLGMSTDVSDQKVALEHLLISMHTDWCTAILKKEYQATINKIAEINKTLAEASGGKQNTAFGKSLLETSFGAKMYKVSGIKTVDLLAKLKQTFPGKAIIIDRWATWCGPCLSEMPHSKKLQQESKGLPVVFVYLCTISGSTESKWKSKVAELKQPGIHILIDEALDTEVSDYFSFSGYPGYAFISKNGIYKPGALKRISDIESKKELSALINNN